MSAEQIFISHASDDDAFVGQLRQALEGQGLRIWVDSRNLCRGAKLAPEIESAIEQARQVLVVLSPGTVNLAWVGKGDPAGASGRAAAQGRWLSRNSAASARHRSVRHFCALRAGCWLPDRPIAASTDRIHC
jgi:TIR domain